MTASDALAAALRSRAASSRRWLPAGSVVGKTTNWPDSSASVFAITRPPSRSSTSASGAACPATTVSPVRSTRTTSNAGRPAVGSAAGEATGPAIFGSRFALAPSDFGSMFALEVVFGDVKVGDPNAGSAGGVAAEGFGPAVTEAGDFGAEASSLLAIRIGAVCTLGQTSFRATNGAATAAAATPMATAPYNAFIDRIWAKPSPLTLRARDEETSRRRDNAPPCATTFGQAPPRISLFTDFGNATSTM